MNEQERLVILMDVKLHNFGKIPTRNVKVQYKVIEDPVGNVLDKKKIDYLFTDLIADENSQNQIMPYQKTTAELRYDSIRYKKQIYTALLQLDYAYLDQKGFSDEDKEESGYMPRHVTY